MRNIITSKLYYFTVLWLRAALSPDSIISSDISLSLSPTFVNSRMTELMNAKRTPF